MAIKKAKLQITGEQSKLLNLIQKQERAVISKIQDLKRLSYSKEELNQAEKVLRKSAFRKVFGNYKRLDLYDLLTGKENENLRKRIENLFLLDYLSLAKQEYIKIKKQEGLI